MTIIRQATDAEKAEIAVILETISETVITRDGHSWSALANAFTVGLAGFLVSQPEPLQIMCFKQLALMLGMDVGEIDGATVNEQKHVGLN